MTKLLNWFRTRDRDKIVRNSFLLPILLVVIISISHVTTWYDLGNPIAWAIYLSVAIEVFALASISAASIKMNRFSIWFLFTLVTSIQVIGNVFFTYNDINLNGSYFKSWVEMIQPAFPEWDSLDHKRLLALVQGGLLPVMSLTALHYYIKFGDKAVEKKAEQPQTPQPEDLFSPYTSEQYPTVEPTEDVKTEEPKTEEPSHATEQEEKIEPKPDVKSEIPNTPPTTNVMPDGRVQETFNFNKFFNDPGATPETMTANPK